MPTGMPTSENNETKNLRRISELAAKKRQVEQEKDKIENELDKLLITLGEDKKAEIRYSDPAYGKSDYDNEDDFRDECKKYEIEEDVIGEVIKETNKRKAENPEEGDFGVGYELADAFSRSSKWVHVRTRENINEDMEIHDYIETFVKVENKKDSDYNENRKNLLDSYLGLGAKYSEIINYCKEKNIVLDEDEYKNKINESTSHIPKGEKYYLSDGILLKKIAALREIIDEILSLMTEGQKKEIEERL